MAQSRTLRRREPRRLIKTLPLSPQGPSVKVRHTSSRWIPHLEEAGALARNTSQDVSKSSNQRLECKLKQEFRFMCIVCMDDLQFHETTTLKCGHQMCNRCLKQSFKLSITDPQHMPPRCFSSDPIPFEYVDQLFDLEFKKAWYKKMCAVYASRNPIYCPKRGCGEFIQQQDIRLTKDRSRYGKCPRCSTKVCLNCSGRWHGHCHKDEATARRLEAEPGKETTQHCILCKSLVEISEGCNHVTWYVLSTFLLDSCLTT